MQIVRKGFALAGIVLALGFSTGSVAADTCCTGFYVSGVIIGGGGFIKNLKNTGPTTGVLKDDSAQDSVAGGGLAVGFNWKRLGAPIRTELEYSHMVRFDYDTRPVFKDKLPAVGFEDNVSSSSLLLNVLYDFDIGSPRWRPYAGFGIGYTRTKSDVNWNDFNNKGGTTTVQNEQFFRDNLSWALTGGAQFDFNANWFAEAAYRYINMGSVVAGFTPAGVKIESDTVYRHELRLGFGYRF